MKRYSSSVLVLVTKSRLVISFMPRPLHLRGRRSLYLIDRLGAIESRPGRCGIEKNLPPAGNRTPAVQSLACRCTDRYRLSYPGSQNRYRRVPNPGRIINSEDGNCSVCQNIEKCWTFYTAYFGRPKWYSFQSIYRILKILISFHYTKKKGKVVPVL
jgi:hypothetical protein